MPECRRPDVGISAKPALVRSDARSGKMKRSACLMPNGWHSPLDY